MDTDKWYVVNQALLLIILTIALIVKYVDYVYISIKFLSWVKS